MSLVATSSVIQYKHIPHVRLLSRRDIPSVSTDVLNRVPLKRDHVERRGGRKRREKVRKGKKEKREKRRRTTCRSTDIAKAGEDTSGGFAQTGNGRTERERRRNIPMHRAPWHRYCISGTLQSPLPEPVDYLADNRAAATYLSSLSLFFSLLWLLISFCAFQIYYHPAPRASPY